MPQQAGRSAAAPLPGGLLTLVLRSDAHHTYTGVCLQLWIWSPVGQTPVRVRWSHFVPVRQTDRPRGDVLTPVSNCSLSSSPLLSGCCEMKPKVHWMLLRNVTYL